LKKACLRRSPDVQPAVGTVSAEENDPFIASPERPPRHLHPAFPHLPKYVIKHEPRLEVPVPLSTQFCWHFQALLQHWVVRSSSLSPHPYHNTAVTALLVSRLQLLLHLILHHITFLLQQGGGFPPFYVGIHIQQLCRLLGLASFPSVSHGFQRPGQQQPLLLLCQGHHTANLQRTLTSLHASAVQINLF